MNSRSQYSNANPVGEGYNVHADINNNFPVRERDETLKNIIPSKLIAPPEFTPAKYGTWKREISFRMELYAYIPEPAILANMGLTANTTLRRVMMQFMRETPVESRTLRNLIRILDSQYQQSSREREMEALDRWMDFKKESSDSIQVFWWKFENLLHRMEGTRSSLSDDVIFYAGLESTAAFIN